MRTDEDGLAGEKIEGTVAKIDRDEPGSRRLGCYSGERDRDEWHSDEVYPTKLG